MTPSDIARAISRQTLDRKCVVLVDNCNWTGHECDVLAVTTDLRIIDIEIKISRADFKRDAAKDKWWHRYYDGTYETVQHKWGESKQAVLKSQPLTHPSKVWKHYFAMPKEVWTPDMVEFLPSPACGVLLLREPVDHREPAVIVQCERRATPAKDAYRLKPAEAMDIARLANLRMWEAYKSEHDAKAEASRLYQQIREAA